MELRRRILLYGHPMISRGSRIVNSTFDVEEGNRIENLHDARNLQYIGDPGAKGVERICRPG
ncbi:MAG: hypothetical protein D6812_07375 [Deltaproteobacteria bacterium]|nr:MAG: hypothetical protein D6812_07375 [Deltaproteobacteria bacterium]